MSDASQMTNCDFCNAPCPARTYRTADSSTVRVRAFVESGPLLQEHRFTPEWEACEHCGKLIDAGDWGGLATRAMRSLADLGVPASEAVKEWLQSTYGELKAAGMVRVRCRWPILAEPLAFRLPMACSGPKAHLLIGGKCL